MMVWLFNKELKNVVVVLGVLMMVSGCATSSYKTAEEIVASRAQEYQNALLTANYEQAYQYLSPGYRETASYKVYLAGKGGAIKREAASVKSVSCEGRVCDVKINLIYRYAGRASIHIPKSAEPMQRVFQEKWIEADGVWWLYLEK